MTLEEFIHYKLMQSQEEIDHFRKEWLKAQKKLPLQFPEHMPLEDWQDSWCNL